MILFPEIEPYATGFLPVGSGHELYWEESGRETGIPVAFLHGGPGGGASARHRRFFDPESYRIVIHDQRGCGRSRCVDALRDNTTDELIVDLERLRIDRGIERWILFGGSWGSTLALAYAERHPDRCLALVLRGIFLGEHADVQWFLRDARMMAPDAWSDFASLVAKDRQSDLLLAYSERLMSVDIERAREAARVWCRYEARCSTIVVTDADVTAAMESANALAMARIEAHYFRHALFLEEGQLLRDIGRVRNIPGFIVQGNQDIICPPIGAFRLHTAWPEAVYVPVEGSGHSAVEPNTAAKLVEATDTLRRQL